MTATLRLIRIETKRNPAIWLVPVIIAVSWWLLSSQAWTEFLWRSTNELIQRTTVPFAAPAMAGAAAWAAGRDHRRGIGDLLQTTPTSTVRRKVILWIATSFWGLLAYGLFAGWMAGTTALQATADGLLLRPVGIAVAAILAHTAWGILLGSMIPSRFTAPVVAIAALGLQQFAASRQIAHSGGFSSTWINRLAAHNDGWNWWPAAFYVALALAALAGIWLYQTRRMPQVSTFGASVVLVVACVVMVWGTYPASGGSTGLRNNFGWKINLPAFVPPEEVCAGSPVEVCAWKGYQPVLDEAVESTNALVRPLVGIPGVPLSINIQDLDVMVGTGRNYRFGFFTISNKLVAEEHTFVDWYPANEAQFAIREWLLMQAGFDTACDWITPERQELSSNTGEPTPESCAASERFLNLSETEQRAWLETNYTALRAGELTLDDLP